MYLPGQRVLTAGIFVIVALTDWLDGFVARKFDQVTDLGKFLDPLADKILVISILLVFVHQVQVDVFTVMFLVARELMITGLRAVAATKKVVIAASKTAKWKTATQMAAIFLIIMDWPYGLVLYYVSFLIALWSMVEYIWVNRRVFK